jgi:hypothetical protein
MDIYSIHIHTLNSNAQYIEPKTCVLQYMEIVILIITRICLKGHAQMHCICKCRFNWQLLSCFTFINSGPLWHVLFLHVVDSLLPSLWFHQTQIYIFKLVLKSRPDVWGFGLRANNFSGHKVWIVYCVYCKTKVTLVHLGYNFQYLQYSLQLQVNMYEGRKMVTKLSVI